MSRNSISFWVRSIINHPYGSATDEDHRLMKVKAPEVWKLSTYSLLFKRNCVVQQVLKAGMWPSHTTFSAFCLRDVTQRYMDTFSICPVVAAQQVI